MNDLFFGLFFTLFIVALLFLDLWVFQREAHVIKIKEALILSAFWIGLALLFNILIYFTRGLDNALSFLTGYLIEKSLSIDNLFVFLLLFKYFHVSRQHVHRVLFWGILGAIIMRTIFIFSGIALIKNFHWIIYIFGAFLVYSGIKLVKEKESEMDPSKNLVLRFFQKFMPVTNVYHGSHFFIKKANKIWATPLFTTLLSVETTDVIFAMDSIPAILAITQDAFIVYTSNIFAILGLRSLYFALEGIMQLFHYLNYALAGILIFVGIKMLISEFYQIPIVYTLGFIAVSILLAIGASLLVTRITL